MSFNSNDDVSSVRAGSAPGLAIRLLKRLVSGLESGRITVESPTGERLVHRGTKPGPEAVLVLHRWRAIRRLVTNGAIGFADAYVDGDWSSPDLTAMIELAAANLEQLDGKVVGLPLLRALNRLRHRLRANTRTGARRNIAFHYDLGNAFYRLWLDRSMSYSSALYERPSQTLEEAQETKLDRILELLGPQPESRTLEIGCGWGGLATRLAASGSRVTGLTLSSEQLAYARNAVEEQGLQERAALELKDYRDVEGRFDRIVAIEMLEAVGEGYWPTFFSLLKDRLEPGGKAVLQIITIDEARFARYRSTPDFIQRHIFPGGMLPTKTIVARQAEAAGLSVVSAEYFGDSYARTLKEWRRRFLAAWPQVERLGFPQSFRGLWEYYLCYCEAGFRAGTIDVGLYVLVPAPVPD